MSHIVEIKSLSHEGRGIASVDGKTIFIDGALPGEKVRYQMIKKHSRFDEAKLEQVILPSEHRQEPMCPHFSICGGCSLQQMSSEFQLQHKQSLLLEQLAHFGQVSPEKILSPVTGPSWNYRHKARLGVKWIEKKQCMVVGFREKKSNKIAHLSECPILAKPMDLMLEPLKNLIQQLTIAKKIPQIEVAIGENQIALVFRHLEPLTDMDEALLRAFSDQYSISVFLQPAGYDSVYLFHPHTGEQQIYYHLKDEKIDFYFDPIQFSQVNPTINEQMIALALEKLELQHQDTALDLFCGFGNFTLPMAKRCHSVCGVEGSESAIIQAQKNAQLNQINTVNFHVCDLSKPFNHENWAKQRYDKVLLDPPRSGAEAVIPWLLEHKPKRIVYISCNPATLARDLGLLMKDKTFKLTEAGILDMFPHTQHVESIAVLRSV